MISTGTYSCQRTHACLLPLACEQSVLSGKKKKITAIYRLQIPALVPEIFKFEKWVKYANEMTDDVIHSTQYYIEYINRATLANLKRRPLKLGSLIVLQETHL